ncbi:uncharacterized protein LOC126670669 [Mercurialis annua]|uniref:uncharacterized protein LOC126670669 n=1 Tax=Mercurialis annua TaxID=3986 RepID=UPI00215F73E3|nr:uncharacterized protein LOC126670669 [Mercurialis annua]
MGCGKSKYAVATANSTVTRKKTSKNNDSNNNIEVKDIAEDHKDLKNGEQEQTSPGGKMISKDSPNRYFSSRKDEDIEGIASERSEYFSPRLDSGKEDAFSDCVKTSLLNDVVSEQETETSPDDVVSGGVKQETENGEPAKEKEEHVAGEAEPGKALEPEIPSSGEKKKNVEEEKLAVPSS